MRRIAAFGTDPGQQHRFLDTNGDILVQPLFPDARDFRESLAAVVVRRSGDAPRWGYIRPDGATAIDPAFLGAGDFVDGRARVRAQSGTGFIEASGESIVEPVWEDARDFSEGLAAVQRQGAWGYIDRSGDVVIEPAFDRAWDFVGGLAEVEQGDIWGYVDTHGEWVWRAENVARSNRMERPTLFYETFGGARRPGPAGDSPAAKELPLLDSHPPVHEEE